jgi:biotin carboxylase
MNAAHRLGAGERVPTVLFLGASVSQLPAIRYARTTGYRVVAVDGDSDAVAFRFADVPLAVDFTDVDAVTELAERHGVDGVLAVCTDRAVVPAADVAARLGLPGVDPGVARLMTNKGPMRKCLERAGLRQPRYRILREGDENGDTAAVGYPAVLKPVDSGGQRGLFKVESAEDLRRHLDEALAFSRSGEAILEEYVDGPELNALIAVRGGEPTTLTLSDRLRPPGTGFGVGWIHMYPSSLGPEALDEARRVGEEAVRALGLEDGIAFPQLIVSPDGVVVVEIAARIAAGQMADLVRHATGIELYDIAIRQALGMPVGDELVTPSFTRPIAIRFLTAEPGPLPAGTVRAIDGLVDVRSSPGVIDAGLYFGVGATINPVQVDADRYGYVIATGNSAPEALDLADAAAGRLLVDTVADGHRAGRRGLRRRIEALFVIFLLAATIAGFVVTEGAKLQHALVGSTRVDHAFSPSCRCRHDVAHIAFRLMRTTPVRVSIVRGSGRRVTTLLVDSHPSRGFIRLAWSGRRANARPLPNGVYYPEVDFPALNRTLRLPSPITLNTMRPHVAYASMRSGRRGLIVRYRFSEPAHALLVVDGKRAVFTRFAARNGVVRWSGTYPDGRRLLNRHPLVRLVAVDSIGNRSQPVVDPL